ncbi:ArsS family sensor histidine kinase [Halarcobacter ebronensis]|uniref:histidine kinase n=1 Tax=Halarcobacter ebronensis TaxID=1462615 RepID=A0A4Q1AW75_9BACT|nr:ArsS family sensor histidine kinase [Halarcobacter ebronensis]QKF81121.1 two-component system sensor histidine kinase [Halarcobacter ebronensis]RXK06424.1 histidine kinase [Halarcobacter ebronensis]
MNRQSIFFTITISFIISIILVIISFSILMIVNEKRVEHYLFEKYRPVAQMVMRYHFRKDIENKKFTEDLKSVNFDLITNRDIINKISYNPDTEVLAQREFKNILFRVLKLKDKQYLYLKKRNILFLIEDKEETTTDPKIYIILGFVIVLIALILSFLVTLRKLIPLKILKDKVSTLGDENFDFECCDTNRKDEVSLLAKEFKRSAKKLQNLKEARNVFIRNIMHELKTPITKGKFLTELERNEENYEKLKEVFNRLETLINEFASIEELISSSKILEKKNYFINDIVDNAKDILMLDDNLVIEKYQNIKLEINYKLFSIAVKNLIDNAIKYSDDKKVMISNEDENLIFENSGKPLEYSLESYYEPFFANEDKQKNSFGLGLYIVSNILRANNYHLEYEYKDNKNIFKCIKEKK